MIQIERRRAAVSFCDDAARGRTIIITIIIIIIILIVIPVFGPTTTIITATIIIIITTTITAILIGQPKNPHLIRSPRLAPYVNQNRSFVAVALEIYSDRETNFSCGSYVIIVTCSPSTTERKK